MRGRQNRDDAGLGRNTRRSASGDARNRRARNAHSDAGTVFAADGGAFADRAVRTSGRICQVQAAGRSNGFQACGSWAAGAILISRLRTRRSRARLKWTSPPGSVCEEIPMNPWRGLRELPREIWILFAATLVNRCGTMVLPFLVLYLTRVLAISISHAALALTVYGIAALLTMPIAGRLSERLGSLFVMRCSLLLSGFVLFLFPLAHSFASILAITFVFAILNESVRPPSLALVSDLVTPEQRQQAFALSRLSVNLGMSLGPAIGGILAVYSFRFLFFADGATSILAGLVLIF